MRDSPQRLEQQGIREGKQRNTQSMFCEHWGGSQERSPKMFTVKICVFSLTDSSVSGNCGQIHVFKDVTGTHSHTQIMQARATDTKDKVYRVRQAANRNS